MKVIRAPWGPGRNQPSEDWRDYPRIRIANLMFQVVTEKPFNNYPFLPCEEGVEYVFIGSVTPYRRENDFAKGEIYLND